ncbi:MAG: glycoside hydrolase family 65 protein [Syntrophobacteraceae bacterium]
MTEWSLIYEGFDPKEEGLREALCTLGNGYFATRGALPEAEADGVHYPGTYLAGGYNRLRTEIAGREVENEDLVNLPNWLPLTFRIPGGSWFKLEEVEILSYRQELDLKRGILLRTVRFRDDKGRESRLDERRLVHMANPHLAAIELTLVPENWSGAMEFRSALDGRVVNSGVERYKKLNKRHLKALETKEINEDSIFLKVETTQSELRIAQAAKTRIFQSGEHVETERRLWREPAYIAHDFVVNIAKGEGVAVEKLVALHTSRDHSISECGLDARKELSRAGSFRELLASHELAWEHLWRRFDIRFEKLGPTEESRIGMVLHLYIFHLLQTTSMHTIDMDVGVPSRGWHGEAYRGHVFWDELFIFPLFNLRVPKITRSLLMYRYRRLNRAKIAAREAGYRGAMYPWQSGSSGREETQEVHLNPKSGRWLYDNSHLQRHVNAAIAYNVWQYYEVTGDIEFLTFHGAEMILENARFWASIATDNPELQRYEILGVMGPDEYHDGYPWSERPGLNNNAYTNIMAVWVLNQALKLFDILPEERCRELCESLSLTRNELDRWRDVSRKMRIVFHGEGIISQFEDYDRLEEFDWQGYLKKYGDIQRLDRILEAEGDTPNRYKASKQADVLMLFYLFSSEELRELFEQLGYTFEYETIPRNIEYYLNRTSHGSTLSRVVNSWVLARSDRIRSWKLFEEALESDVSDIQGGTTPEGIHLGAMAGTIDQLTRCYTEIKTRGDVLRFNPQLPEELGKLHMRIRYRGHSLEVDITRERLKIEAMKSAAAPIRLGLNGAMFELKAGEAKTLDLN